MRDYWNQVQMADEFQSYKMMRLLFIGLLGQALISCINMNDPDSQSNYIEMRGKFDKSLVALFPDRLPNNMLGYRVAFPEENAEGTLSLTIKYFSSEEYLETKTKYLKQSKYVKTSTDHCLFLMDNFNGMNQERCGDFYPIPGAAIFEPSLDLQSESKVIGSDVLFIDVQPGDFLYDSDKDSRRDLPENWTHGYSTGVTTNDNDRTIQIWLVVW